MSIRSRRSARSVLPTVQQQPKCDLHACSLPTLSSSSARAASSSLCLCPPVWLCAGFPRCLPREGVIPRPQLEASILLLFVPAPPRARPPALPPPPPPSPPTAGTRLTR